MAKGKAAAASTERKNGVLAVGYRPVAEPVPTENCVVSGIVALAWISHQGMGGCSRTSRTFSHRMRAEKGF